MTTLTTIEKAAKLMGISINCQNPDDEKYYLAATGFNPYTSKSDLMDVECELGIDVEWSYAAEYVHAIKRNTHREYLAHAFKYFFAYQNKFTARAHAVMAVVEQIYDFKFGKDGE